MASARAIKRPPATHQQDGPPAIQRQTITDWDGTIIRDPSVQRAEWRDPDDTAAMDRRSATGRTGKRYIQGYRRTWIIDTLARTSPREFTVELVQAATRLLNDIEMRRGTMSGATGERVDGGADGPGRIDAQVAAGIRVDAALVAAGAQGAMILGMSVVENWTLSKIAATYEITSDKASGRIFAALTRLCEHYTVGKSNKSPGNKYEPVIDATITDIPQSRLGRQFA